MERQTVESESNEIEEAEDNEDVVLHLIRETTTRFNTGLREWSLDLYRHPHPTLYQYDLLRGLLEFATYDTRLTQITCIMLTVDRLIWLPPSLTYLDIEISKWQEDDTQLQDRTRLHPGWRHLCSLPRLKTLSLRQEWHWHAAWWLSLSYLFLLLLLY